MKLIILPCFVLSFVLVSCLQTANGQSNVTTNFTPYQNPSLGFSIEHPSDWVVDEDTSGKFKVVRFNAPDGSNPIFVVGTEDTAPYLDTDTMTLKNTTLEQSVQKKLNFFTTFSLESNIAFKLIRQNDITVGGNPATKIEYSWGIFYWFEVLTIGNGKLYDMTYKERPLNVPTTFPLANKMVDSFTFLK